MARIKGLSSFASNLEPKLSGPLDARTVVDTVSDLVSEAAWKADDGTIYVYKGMLVSVVNDLEARNGIYRLAALPYTEPSSWVKLGTEGGTGGAVLVWFPDDAPPANPVNGDAYYDTALGKSMVWYDGDWRTVANDGQDSAVSAYTNETPSVITVGGIAAGTTFTDLAFGDFVDMLLYPELFPTLTDPSSTFTCSISGYREIGEVIATISFNSTFSRGSISPQYQSDSPYRSGDPNTYIYTGTGLATVSKTTSTDAQTVNDYTVLQGVQSWTGRVSYDAGVQPKGSKGTDYQSPKAAGTTSTVTRSFTGVYPYFATTASVDAFAKQPLASMSSAYVETEMAGESGSGKQAASFPDAWSAFTGVQFLNTVSNQWEWIGGTKAGSLASFTETQETRSVQGVDVDYNRYTHNGSLIGSRRLRWYTT